MTAAVVVVVVLVKSDLEPGSSDAEFLASEAHPILPTIYGLRDTTSPRGWDPAHMHNETRAG